MEDDLKAEIPAFLHYLTTLPPVDFSTDRTGFTPVELENESLRKIKRESKSPLYKNLKEYFEDLFLNELQEETEFYADVVSIKVKYFDRDHQIDNKYIRNVLNDDFKLTPSVTGIYFKPFVTGEGKTGKPYLFKRELFTEVEAVKKLPF